MYYVYISEYRYMYIVRLSSSFLFLLEEETESLLAEWR